MACTPLESFVASGSEWPGHGASLRFPPMLQRFWFCWFETWGCASINGVIFSVTKPQIGHKTYCCSSNSNAVLRKTFVDTMLMGLSPSIALLRSSFANSSITSFNDVATCKSDYIIYRRSDDQKTHRHRARHMDSSIWGPPPKVQSRASIALAEPC
jgi:hypothetical protein